MKSLNLNKHICCWSKMLFLFSIISVLIKLLVCGQYIATQKGKILSKYVYPVFCKDIAQLKSYFKILLFK